MIIQNQQKNSIYVLENLERVFINDGNTICAYTSTGCFHKLAEYSNLESAKEVFDRLIKAISHGKEAWFFPPSAWQFNNEYQQERSARRYDNGYSRT